MRYIFNLLFIIVIILLSCKTSDEPLYNENEPDYILQTRLKEYEYIKNQFYLVDTYYQSTFESSFDPTTMQWIVNDPGKLVDQLDVWINDQPNSPYSLPAWAVLNPNLIDPDSVYDLPVIRCQNVYGFFRRLDVSEYTYDKYRGFFYLKRPLSDSDLLAIAYSNKAGEKCGMLWQEIVKYPNQIPILKLIKDEHMTPYCPTWPLMMQNVYYMGVQRVSHEGFDVKVFYTKTGEDQSIQSVGDQLSFMYLLGLDRLDDTGNLIIGGDNKLDYLVITIFDRINGYILFPSLRPFDPQQSYKFKIDNSLQVDIYNTIDENTWYTNHKFDIQISILDTLKLED